MMLISNSSLSTQILVKPSKSVSVNYLKEPFEESVLLDQGRKLQIEVHLKDQSVLYQIINSLSTYNNI